MRYFFVDASALIKRYHQEPGTAVITRILDDLLTTSPKRVVVPLLGLAEVVWQLSSANKMMGGWRPSCSVWRQPGSLKKWEWLTCNPWTMTMSGLLCL